MIFSGFRRDNWVTLNGRKRWLLRGRGMVAEGNASVWASGRHGVPQGQLPGSAASLEGALRILQVITPARIAGAERSTTSLCEHLVKAGHEVIVACKKNQPLIQVMQDVGLDVRGLDISGKGNVGAALRLARLVRQERIEVINTQLSTAALWGSVAGRLTRVPTVATVRALNTKAVYVLANRVIAVSHAVKEHLVCQGMHGDRIDVVYNGIDPERYRLRLSRPEARQQLGLDPDALIFVVIAHLSIRKGHAVYLDAAARIASGVARQLHVFAGEGPERENLERQARQLGLAERVIYAGFTSDVLPVYAAADVVVLPSITGEGLPRALLEGGLVGRPVIGTRLSGSPEIVDDGVTGLIVPSGDVAGLAEAMHRLAEDADLRERMGAAGTERISRLFSVPSMVEGTVATYRRALKEHGRR
jgi:glycosyltransferase involved in cell wall biosynthesis